MDRVKESIFNVLGKDIAGSKVLDLFAGSGSLGLEAISRGCKLAYFVDSYDESISLIKNNLSLISGIEKKYVVIKSDAAGFLKDFNFFTWDYIFLDPPFRIENKIMTEIFNILSNNKKIIDKNSVIIYEFFFKRDINSEIGDFEIFKTSGFGEKKVVYLKKR